MALPTITMTKSEFRDRARKVVLVSQTIASFTPTPKDDEVVAVFDAAVNNDDVFNKLCEALNIKD